MRCRASARGCAGTLLRVEPRWPDAGSADSSIAPATARAQSDTRQWRSGEPCSSIGKFCIDIIIGEGDRLALTLRRRFHRIRAESPGLPEQGKILTEAPLDAVHEIPRGGMVETPRTSIVCDGVDHTLFSEPDAQRG